jgi:hypothetical protein
VIYGLKLGYAGNQLIPVALPPVLSDAPHHENGADERAHVEQQLQHPGADVRAAPLGGEGLESPQVRSRADYAHGKNWKADFKLSWHLISLLGKYMAINAVLDRGLDPGAVACFWLASQCGNIMVGAQHQMIRPAGPRGRGVEALRRIPTPARALME